MVHHESFIFHFRSVLAGICEALIEKKIAYKWYTANKWKFSLEIFAITYFTELLIIPLRKVIDLTKVPQDLRSWLCRDFTKFGDDLNVLILGSGSGGVVPEAFSDTVLKGNSSANRTYSGSSDRILYLEIGDIFF